VSSLRTLTVSYILADRESIQSMSGKVAIVTGGNQGMGLITAQELLKLGYKVTITCRSAEKGREAVDTLSQYGTVEFLTMDLADLSTVYAFAKAYQEPVIDLLVNNAGIMNTPYAITVDGFEAQYQVNHLGHFLLTRLLFNKLRAAGGTARVVTLSSRAHMRHTQSIDYDNIRSVTPDNYDGWMAYGRSKLSNILFSKALAKRFPLESCGVAFFSVHPGLVDTGLLVKGSWTSPSAMPVESGVACTIYVSTSPEVNGQSGEYYHNEVTEFFRGTAETPDRITQVALNEQEADTCFDRSMEMLGLNGVTFGDA
jgi:NAD(P)-dependent dehydrogenase (short-subunit alcohol dehydrogenase family)